MTNHVNDTHSSLNAATVLLCMIDWNLHSASRNRRAHRIDCKPARVAQTESKPRTAESAEDTWTLPVLPEV